MGPDIITGTADNMAHIFRPGTREDHQLKVCWCKPVYKFDRTDAGILGAVYHR